MARLSKPIILQVCRIQDLVQDGAKYVNVWTVSWKVTLNITTKTARNIAGTGSVQEIHQVVFEIIMGTIPWGEQLAQGR